MICGSDVCHVSDGGDLCHVGDGSDLCDVGDGSNVGNGCSGRGQSFGVPFPFSQMSTGFPMTQN